MLTDIEHKLFTLQKLKGIGPSTLQRIINIPDLDDISIAELAKADKKLAKALEVHNALENALRAADEDIEAALKNNARIICALNDEYPELLKQLPDRPFFLYVKGKWHFNPIRSVAIVGTRKPTEHGKIISKRITEYFVSDGWSVISGLALGCDAIAHKTALEHDGHTVGVLAHGLHTIAPKQHVNLANRIIDNGGVLITEYGFGVNPYPHQFVKRDRIQAGLAKGVIMIQSDLVGGSLHASRAAIEYQRVLAIPIPTERDLANHEDKIEANMILSGKDKYKKVDLLKCNESALNRIFYITSKDDYSHLSSILSAVWLTKSMDRSVHRQKPVFDD